MEKMCTVQMVKENGYKPDSDFDDKKCLTKEAFLGHFSKDNYEFSISVDRGLKQLFPYSDVTEKLKIEPLLQFENSEVKLKYSEFEFENPFIVENLTDLRVSSITGSTNDAYAFIGEDIVIFILPQDSENNTADDYQYTVTVTGTRTDGQGEYSNSFTVIRKYFAVDITFKIDSELGTGLGTNYISMANNIIKRDMSDYEVYLASGRNSKGDPVEYEDGKYSSGKWEFNFTDQRSFDYTMSKINKDGTEKIENSPNSMDTLLFNYDDYKAYSKVAVAIKSPYKQPIQIGLSVSDSLGTNIKDWEYRTNEDPQNWNGSFNSMTSEGVLVIIGSTEYLQVRYNGDQTVVDGASLWTGDDLADQQVGIFTDGKTAIGYDTFVNGGKYVIRK